MLDSRWGQLWSSVSMGSGIVSWPSIQPGLHASQSLSSIYCTIASKKLAKGGSHGSINTFFSSLRGLSFSRDKKAGSQQARLSCKTALWIVVKPLGLYRLFPGKQQLFHCNECMHNCGVAYHMTVFHIMNTSDANSKRFNLSKRVCAAVWLALLQPSPNLVLLYSSREKKGKWCTWQPQMTLIKLSALMKWLTDTVIKMMGIYQWQDRNCTVVQWLWLLQIYMFRPQRRQGFSSSILTQWVANGDPA